MNPLSESDLRCYVCGEPVESDFWLASMSRNVDRVFVVHNRHIDVVDDECPVKIHVRRVVSLT